MEQKTIWVRFSHFGTNLLVFMVILSCNKQIDYRVRANYIYINETDSSINYPTDWDEFNVSAKDTFIYETDFEGPESVEADDYEPPMIGCYPCIIHYGVNLCDTLSKEEINSPLNIDNYESKKLGNRYYEFTFRFTQQMLDSTKYCQ